MPLMKVRVVTYNIAGNHGDYGEREDGIILTLLSTDADIICLQEVSGVTTSSTQAHLIAARLAASDPSYSVSSFAGVRNWPVETGVYGNAIISRLPAAGPSDRIELGHGSLTQDDGSRMPGATEERVAAVAQFHLPNRHELVVLSAHFGIFNSVDSRSDSCLAPVLAIDKWVLQHVEAELGSRPTGATVLLCGDLNADPTSLIFRGLTTTSTAVPGVEPWDAGRGFFEPGLSRYLHTPRPPPLHTRPKIDYLLRKTFSLECVSSLPQLTVASPASDHNPVLTTFVFPIA